VAQPVYANRAIGDPTPAAEPRRSSHPGPERRGSIRATPRPCSGSCGKLAEITRRVPRARGPDERHAGTKRRRGEPERRSSTVPNPSDPGCPAASVVVAGPTPPRWAVWREEPTRRGPRGGRAVACHARHDTPGPTHERARYFRTKRPHARPGLKAAEPACDPIRGIGCQSQSPRPSRASRAPFHVKRATHLAAGACGQSLARGFT